VKLYVLEFMLYLSSLPLFRDRMSLFTDGKPTYWYMARRHNIRLVEDVSALSSEATSKK